MDFDATRIIRTPYSERFVLRRRGGDDFAALELHYLTDGSVAGTLVLFQEAGVAENEVPAILARIDQDLLPEVSIQSRNLSFTVVVGRVLGSFTPDADDEPAEPPISSRSAP